MPRRHDARGPAPGTPASANVAYGIHSVRVLLQRAPQRVRQLWLSSSRDSASRLQELRALAAQAGVTIVEADDSQLDKLADGERHQGVVVELAPRAGDPETQLEEALEAIGAAPPLLLVLDGVTDPHNLGACLRSADAAGVAAVIVPRDRAAGLTPVVRKVAAGAAETVPLVQVVNLARTLRELKERGVWLVGTSDDAARTLYDARPQWADRAGPGLGGRGHASPHPRGLRRTGVDPDGGRRREPQRVGGDGGRAVRGRAAAKEGLGGRGWGLVGGAAEPDAAACSSDYLPLTPTPSPIPDPFLSYNARLRAALRVCAVVPTPCRT